MSATRLGGSSSPASPTLNCQGPQDHIVGSNTMECHCPELLGDPLGPPEALSGLRDNRVHPRTQTSPCESPGRGRWWRPTTPAQPSSLLPTVPDQSQARTSQWAPPPTSRPPHRSHQPPSRRGRARGDVWRVPHPARTPGTYCTGVKAPNASPAFLGPPRPRRPPSLPGLEAGAAAAAAAAAGCGRRGSGFVGPGGSGGLCCGAGGGGSGGRGRRLRVGEAGGRVVPVHRGGCVGREGSSGGSSRALCEGGGRGGTEGAGEEKEKEVAAEGPAPLTWPRPADRRRALWSVCAWGSWAAARAARPRLGVREAAASAARTRGGGGGGGFAPCWWISQDAPPALRPAPTQRPALAARGPRGRPGRPPPLLAASRWSAGEAKARSRPSSAGSRNPEGRPPSVARGSRTSRRPLLQG